MMLRAIVIPIDLSLRPSVPLCLRGETDLVREDDLQGISCHAKFHWSLADELAVGIDIERMLSFDLHARCLPIFNFFETEMAAKIDRGEQAEKFEYIHGANHAEIEFAVVELCLGSDFHSAAISGRVGDCGEDRWQEGGGISIAGNLH